MVQLFGREDARAGALRALNAAHLDAHLRSIRVYALYFPVIEFLTTLALASLIVASGGRGARPAALTVGTVAAFLQLVRRFFQPLQDLSEKFNILQAAMAASERIFSAARHAGGRRCRRRPRTATRAWRRCAPRA